MNNYQKIATIVFRCLGCYLLLFAAIEWGIIAAGALLTNLGLSPRLTIASEPRLLSSVFYLIAGLVLYSRSKSLGFRITEALQDE
jgi:hypothetical protein